MKQKFVRLTYDILKTEGLTSTDKIVLAYNLGMARFFASPAHIAVTLGMTASAVKKSIIKLRKLGLWREAAGYSGSKATATRVADTDTRVSRSVTRVADKKSFSPMKTSAGIESILEKNKKEGIESAAVASPLSHSPQTVLKKLDLKTTVTSESQKNKISTITGSEAPMKTGTKPTGAAVPLGPDGRPLTKTEMNAANFAADWAGQRRPYIEADISAGSDANPTAKDIAQEFAALFERKAG